MYTRKGQVIFHRKDIYELDSVFAQVIYTGLTQYKKLKRQGVIPAVLAEITEDAPYGEATEEAIQKWEGILDKMIFAFSPYTGYEDIEPNITDIVYQPIDDVTDAVKFLPKKGFTEDDVAAYDERHRKWTEEYERKREEGRILFATYFHSLYD